MTARLPLLVIAGPTGVGKTAAAVALACRLPLEVVSADSRQVYRGMDIATGKPTRAERAAVAHHLVDVVDPDDRYSAARFRDEAVAAIAAIHARGRLPVVVGGTGLYIRALLRGLDDGVPADPAFRAELAGIAAEQGRAALHDRLRDEAPAMARRLHPNDAVRVMRALERLRAGAPVGDEQRAWRDGAPAWDTIHVGLTMDREALARRLRTRAAAMVAAGLVDEVRGLLARGYDPALPALQGIGYREFAQVAAGTVAPEEALRLMQRDTVRYARRQWTWFSREPGIEWLDMKPEAGVEHAATALEARLARGGVIG
ncbi:MAG TPA: tRNA (adenosine(37)-N6)-dimethylallyltransferase MiaA [Candidatus Limnocylindria bacterium]|nr:tRNA (adenosine(37)-N6)-dimethylallyltransferase MiaA [Candidatus Limnocylindria bacterium]